MTTDKTELAAKKKHKSTGGTKKMESLENRVAPVSASGMIAGAQQALEGSNNGPSSFASGQANAGMSSGAGGFSSAPPPTIINNVTVDFSGAQLGGSALAEGGHSENINKSVNNIGLQNVNGGFGSDSGGSGADGMQRLKDAFRGGEGSGGQAGGGFPTLVVGGDNNQSSTHSTNVEVDIDASKHDNSIHDSNNTTDNSKSASFSLTTGDINSNNQSETVHGDKNTLTTGDIKVNSDNKLNSDNQFNLDMGRGDKSAIPREQLVGDGSDQSFDQNAAIKKKAGY